MDFWANPTRSIKIGLLIPRSGVGPLSFPFLPGQHTNGPDPTIKLVTFEHMPAKLRMCAASLCLLGRLQQHVNCESKCYHLCNFAVICHCRCVGLCIKTMLCHIGATQRAISNQAQSDLLTLSAIIVLTTLSSQGACLTEHMVLQAFWT